MPPKVAARRLAVSLSTVYALLRAGRLASYRVGARGRGKWLIRQDDLDAFLAACWAAGPVLHPFPEAGR